MKQCDHLDNLNLDLVSKSGFLIELTLSYPRTTKKNHISDKTFDGATAFIILDSISIIHNLFNNYTFFKCSSVTLKLPSTSPFLTSIACLHHPNTLNLLAFF